MAPPEVDIRSGKPDPDFKREFESSGAPIVPSIDIITIRRQTDSQKEKARQALGPPPEGLAEYNIQIDTRDGSSIPARVYAPSPSSNPAGQSLPLFLNFHGGGYCIGNPEDDVETNRLLALELPIVILSVGYRLAPEHPFPTCVYDGYDALQWAVQHASALKIDTKAGLIIGGTSSGGNIAQAVIYLNRDEQTSIDVTGQFLSVTNILPPPVVPERYKQQYQSVEENKIYAIPPAEMIQTFLGSYKPKLDSPLFVPFNHPKGHAGIPPTYLQVCGLDGLRDEELIYEQVLREENNIPTRIDFYPGLPHHFWEFFPNLERQKVKRLQDTVQGFRWLLQSNK